VCSVNFGLVLILQRADAKHATMKETFERISKCFKKVVCFNFPRPSDNVSHHQARTGTLNLCGKHIGLCIFFISNLWINYKTILFWWAL